jgi:iron(III) transport system permease protein
LSVFLIYHLFILLFISFINPVKNTFSLHNYVNLFQEKDILEAFINTVKLAFWCACITTIISIPMAFGASRTNLPLRNMVRLGSFLCFASPSFIGAIAWIMLLGPRAGKINVIISNIFGLNKFFNIFSFAGIVFVSSLFLYPLVFFPVVSALDNMDASFEDSARILGANKIRTLISVTFPMVIPSIFSGMILVFLHSFVLFGVPAFLGMPAGVFVVSTKIYHLFLAMPPRYEMSAALATPILLITAILLLAEWFYLRRRRYITIGGKFSHPEALDLKHWKYVICGFCIFVIFLAVILPTITLLASSFFRFWGRPMSWENLSLFQYKELFFGFAQTELLVALKNSLILGTGAAFLSVIFSVIMVWIVES